MRGVVCSHLGPAVTTVLRLKELGLKELALKEMAPEGAWRDDAQRVIEACTTVRSANSLNLWREQIAVSDYACRLTERYLERALAEPGYLSRDSLRADYLEGPSPVPFNRIMIATFFLTGMDIAHRAIGWLDALRLPWERAMVMMAGVLRPEILATGVCLTVVV
jgi:hypothetical protein